MILNPGSSSSSRRMRNPTVANQSRQHLVLQTVHCQQKTVRWTMPLHWDISGTNLKTTAHQRLTDTLTE